MFLVVNAFLHQWVSQSFSTQLLGAGAAAASSSQASLSVATVSPSSKLQTG